MIEQVSFKPRARILKLLGEQLIGNSKLAIFELVKNASYQYEECAEKCTTYTKMVVPNLNDNVLIIKVNDKNSVSIFDNYLELYYVINGKKYVLTGHDIEVLAKNNNQVYLSVSSNLVNAQKLTLAIKKIDGEYDIELR